MRRIGCLMIAMSWGCRNTSTNMDSAHSDTGDSRPDIPSDDQDNDGDGFTENEGDCDDSATTVHPNGVEGEVSDGRDNDCNGIVDDMNVCPGESNKFNSLQAAIDAAPEGMTLVVCPGTYQEMLSIEKRSIGIWAKEGPERTTIQGNQTDSVITIQNAPSVLIYGFTILGGRSLENGGGIHATNSQVTIRDNHLDGNQAVLWGGGIYCDSCTGTISGNTIDGSRAAHGGGIATHYGQLEIINNLISNNTSYSTDNGVFSNNYGGGGGALIVGDSSFGMNMVESNHSETHGGGVYILQGEGDVWDNTFQFNTTGYDGAGLLTNLSRNHLHGNLFAQNTAFDDGGGMRVYVGGMTIENNQFIDNIAHNQGGAMKVSHAANIIRGNTIEGNSADEAGGGIELDNDASRVEDNLISGNTAYRGGGIHTWFNEEAVWIVDNVITGNTALWCGGGIQADYDYHTVTVQRNEITHNEAPYGGGICTYDYVDLVLENSVIAHNHGSSTGGGTYLSGGVTNIVNSIVFANTAADRAGMDTYWGTINVVNSIFMSHKKGTAWTSDGTTSEVSYSLFYNNELDLNTGTVDAESGNMLANPLFADANGGDWTLQSESPAIDGGDPKILDNDGSRSDIGLHGGPAAD